MQIHRVATSPAGRLGTAQKGHRGVKLPPEKAEIRVETPENATNVDVLNVSGVDMDVKRRPAAQERSWMDYSS